MAAVGAVLSGHMDPQALQQDTQLAARLEARALERMACALRDHARQLLESARARDALGTREAAFQLEAFAERCAQLDALVAGSPDLPLESRLARLEKLVSALECSRAYLIDLQEIGSRRTPPPAREPGRARGLCRRLLALATG